MMKQEGSERATSARRKRSSNVVETGQVLRVETTSARHGDFFERVWALVRLIPRGKVTTYGHIARALGAASSARMVGWAMNASHSAEWVPAHRVLNRNGELSGKMHFATPTLMRELLEAENVQFDGERVKMSEHVWIPPMSADI